MASCGVGVQEKGHTSGAAFVVEFRAWLLSVVLVVVVVVVVVVVEVEGQRDRASASNAMTFDALFVALV